MLGSDFFDSQHVQKNFPLPKKMRLLSQRINYLKSLLNRERAKMKKKLNSDRKRQTRHKIQLGGLLQKSGLTETFSIAPRDDLQDFDNLQKAAQLLGFLTECFEETAFTDVQFKQWQKQGERFLRG